MTFVKEIMTRDVVTLGADASLRDAIRLMTSGRFRRIPVVTDGRIEGIITDRDIRRSLNSPVVFHERSSDEYLLNTVKVGASMTINPLTIGPDEDILRAAELMEQHKIGGLPVVSGDLIMGIITLSDLINYLIRELKKSQKGQGPDA